MAYGDPEVYVAAISGYDPSSGTVKTIYRGTYGFSTKATDTPANTPVLAGLKQPAFLQRDMFDQGSTMGRSRMGFGDVILANDDGQEDALLDWGFDGRTIVIYRGVLLQGVTRPVNFPADWTIALQATMEQPETSIEQLVFKLRDNQFLVSLPAQQTKFTGGNVLPNGLEGLPGDLAGKPKPLAYGAPVNVSPPCVNTDKLIFQAKDGAVADIPAVYDRGVALDVGTSWVDRTSSFGSTEIFALATDGAGKYIAGGFGKIASSTDGVNWTQRTFPAAWTGSNQVTGMAWNGTVFVMVGFAGRIATSPDGITWTDRGLAPFTGAFTNINALVWGSGPALFVIGGGSGNIATSPDGITWTQRSNPFGTFAIISLGYGNGVFVAMNNKQTTFSGLATSTNGIAWTERAYEFSTNGILCMTYGNGLYVMGTNDNVLATSVDAITWIKRTSAWAGGAVIGGVEIRAIVYSAQGFMAVGTSGQLQYSQDGITWKNGPTLLGGDNINAIIRGSSTLFIAAGAAGKLASTAASTYASQADLLDDTLQPLPGAFKVYPAGAYFRLGAARGGLITADVLEGTFSSDRSAAQLFKRLLVDRGGISVGNISASDLTALDALNNSVLALWQDTDVALSDLLDLVANSVGAWWGVDYTGQFRIQRFDAPSGSPVMDLGQNDVKNLDKIATSDEDRGVPLWRVILKYGRNWTVQTATDLAGSVTQQRIAQLAQEWSQVKVEDATVKTTHLLAGELSLETLLVDGTAATTEATRILTMRKVRRDRIQFDLPYDASTAGLDLGVVMRLTYNRFGYNAGKLFRVIGLEPDGNSRMMKTTAWG